MSVRYCLKDLYCKYKQFQKKSLPDKFQKVGEKNRTFQSLQIIFISFLNCILIILKQFERFLFTFCAVKFYTILGSCSEHDSSLLQGSQTVLFWENIRDNLPQPPISLFTKVLAEKW